MTESVSLAAGGAGPSGSSAGAMQASATQTSASTPPIRYRSESGTLADQATGVLLVLALLLAAALALALVAKRKGWLDRWVARSGAGVVGSGGAALRVEQTLRLSPRTVLYRVGDGQDRYLVIESTVHAQLAPLAPDQASGREATAPEGGNDG